MYAKYDAPPNSWLAVLSYTATKCLVFNVQISDGKNPLLSHRHRNVKNIICIIKNSFDYFSILAVRSLTTKIIKEKCTHDAEALIFESFRRKITNR